MAIRDKATTLAENVAESGAACLLTMVQGNVLAMGLSHWIIASQTGLVAGAASVAAVTLAGQRNRWAVAGVLGVTTAVVDYVMHPGMIGSGIAEALITGAVAAVLSLVVHALVGGVRRRRQAA